MTATCRGKIPYNSMAAALGALDHMRRRPAYRGSLNAYGCPECGQYHLGRRVKVKKEKQNA